MRESTLIIIYFLKFIELPAVFWMYFSMLYYWQNILRNFDAFGNPPFKVFSTLGLIPITLKFVWNPILNNLRLKYVIDVNRNARECCYSNCNKL